MKIVSSRAHYSSIRALQESAFRIGSRIPDMVFDASFRKYLIIDFDVIFTRKFFRWLSIFSKSRKMIFSVLDPSPRDYFLEQFGMYGMFEGFLNEDESKYIKALNQDPGGSPGDALGINSSVVTLFDENADWGIWGERDLEFALVAFKNKDQLYLAQKSEEIFFFKLEEIGIQFPQISKFVSQLRVNYGLD